MPAPIETTVVGTYQAQEEAEGAREHLMSAGIDPVTVGRASGAAWQVQVTVADRDRALEELKRREQHVIPDSW